MAAAREGHIEIVNLLLDNGANPLAKDNDGEDGLLVEAVMVFVVVM